MSDSQDIQMIVLMAADRPAVRRVPGSVVVTANCGHLAFISSTTVAFMATPEGVGAYTICTNCMSQEYLGEVPQKRPIPGVDADLVSAFGVAAADQLMALARDRGLIMKADRLQGDDT